MMYKDKQRKYCKAYKLKSKTEINILRHLGLVFALSPLTIVLSLDKATNSLSFKLY